MADPGISRHEDDTGPRGTPEAEVPGDPAEAQRPAAARDEAGVAADPVLIEVEEPEAVREGPLPPLHPAPAPARRRGGALALVLGGLIAAGAGFALSQVVPQGWPLPADTTLAERLDAQEGEIARLSAELAGMTAPAPVDLAPLEARLDALAERLDAAEAAAAAARDALAALPGPAPDPGPRIDALEARLASVEAAPPGTVVQGGGDPAALAALRQEIASLRDGVAGQGGEVASAVAEVNAAAEAAKAALAEAAAEAEALRAAAAEEARRSRIGTALGRMRAALESGLPFATAVAELDGVEVPAPLAATAASGVPTLASLQARFPEAARRALEDSLRADLGDTTAERLGSFLRTQVGARSLTPREGTDPDAVLSRAEAALAEGRLADALAEIAALPDPGRAALADWTAQAQLRLDAAAALDALAVTLGEG